MVFFLVQQGSIAGIMCNVCARPGVGDLDRGVSVHQETNAFLPSGHGSGQLALGGPTGAVGLDNMTSRGPFQAEPVCDSYT